MALARERDDAVVESLCLGGWHGAVETRAPTAAGVPVERELTHEEKTSRDVGEGAIHLALIVLENAKTGDLVDQITRLGFAVPLADTDERHESTFDATYDFPRHLHPSRGDALNDGAHFLEPQ